MTACAILPAQAGIIRHDKPDSQYTALAANFPVGMLTSNEVPLRGSGVLISPEWVLTASHFSLGTGRQFTVAGETRAAGEIVRHPDSQNPNPIHLGFDLTLIKLDAPIFNVAPAELAEAGQSVLGQTATYAGYGETGDGNSGNIVDSTGTLRAGMNVIDQKGGSFGGVSYSNNIVWADFDKPVSAGSNTGVGSFNQMGSKDPLTLEYLVANKDSGGGVFVEVDGRQVLVAINSLVLLNNVDGDSGSFEYGDQMASTLIGPSLDWINDTALPTLLAGDANNDLSVTGLDIIAVQEHFGNIGAANGLLQGDANDDGLVTGVDLITIQETFGNVVGAAAAPSPSLIPEPATAGVLFLLTLTALLGAGERRLRRVGDDRARVACAPGAPGP